MKKRWGILYILLLFLISTLYVNGAQSTVEMSMDGRLLTFNVVQLKLDDVPIQSDVPPIIHQDRTLVPLRAVMENIDADIEWDGVNYQVTVKTTDKVMLLKIDSEVAIVNGAEVRLPDNVPPKLVNNRTMVPIRFVAETVGLGVGWDDDSKTVLLTSPVIPPDPVTPTTPETPDTPETPANEETPIQISDVVIKQVGNASEIRIKTSGPVSYREMTLSNPVRLVFDIDHAMFTLSNSSFLLANGTYSQLLNQEVLQAVRVSQFEKDPYVTRVVVELKQETGYQVEYDEAAGEMVIYFKNYVRSVTTEKANTKEVVIIEGDQVTNYNVLALENPKRLVVDIKDAFLPAGSYQLKPEGKTVKSIRVAQFVPDENYLSTDKIVRVVMDLQESVDFEEIQLEVVENKLLVHLEGSPYTQLVYEETGWTTALLTFKGEGIGQYQLEHDPAENQIQLLLPKTSVPLEFREIDVADHMIQSITAESVDSNYDLVKIRLEKDVTYEVGAASNTAQLVLELKNTNRYRDILVVVDAGHGGDDPGAISSILKLYEKDIVFDVALRYNQLLQEAGFRTYMTRSDDVKIELDDRALVANQLGANLFVSIHANAFTRSTLEGIETWYFPSEKFEADLRDNKALAQIFQNEMVAMLGGVDRGIKPSERLVVLRKTTVPAVLTEMGFLTNPAEEQKLNTPEYRQKVAQALFNATVKYFNQTNWKQ